VIDEGSDGAVELDGKTSGSNPEFGADAMGGGWTILDMGGKYPVSARAARGRPGVYGVFAGRSGDMASSGSSVIGGTLGVDCLTVDGMTWLIVGSPAGPLPLPPSEVDRRD
jgi:hypothetical protein